MDAGRRWVCERARGRVLEVGIGTGLSLANYGQDVDLVGVDLTPAMLCVARRRSRRLHRDVDLRVADATALPFPDRTFDSVVFTYSLCSIPDPRQALAEAARVLRDGGSLLTTEHVRSSNYAARVLQLLLNPFFVWLEADSLLRDPLPLVVELGYQIDERERWACGVMQRLRATKVQRSVHRVATPMKSMSNPMTLLRATTGRAWRRIASTRAPIAVPVASRAFTDDALAELRAARWTGHAMLRFLRRITVRSWEQARARPGVFFEVTAGHAALLSHRRGAWPVVSWFLAVTHLGLLGENQDRLGWANRLTLLRGNLPALTRGRAPWLACVALATDAMDGELARRDAETAFGGYADELADVAFWTWFVWHHDDSMAWRLLATSIWVGPVVVAAVAYLVLGRAVVVPRMNVVRTTSVGLQIAIAVRAGCEPARRRCANGGPTSRARQLGSGHTIRLRSA